MAIKRALLLFLASFLLTALPAQAQNRSAAVELGEIREMILYARYDDAIAAGLGFLDRTDIDAESRNLGLEVLATAYLANRDTENAAPVLRELFTRDPGHRLSDADASPVVQGAFQRAREEAPEPLEVQLEHQAPELEQYAAPVIEARVRGGSDAVAELRVHYRSEGAPQYATLVLRTDPQGRGSARVPVLGTGQEAEVIEYYLEALAPSQTRIGVLGSAGHPLRLTVPARTAPMGLPGEAPEESSGGVASKWWFWTIMVAVVAGGATAAAIALSDGAPEGTLGGADLR